MDILNDKGKIIIINNNTSLITKTKDEFSKILNTKFYVTTEYILNSIENSKLKNFINIEKYTKKANLNTSILNEFNLESTLFLSFLLGADILTIPEKELLYLKNKFKYIKYIDENISSIIIKKK